MHIPQVDQFNTSNVDIDQFFRPQDIKCIANNAKSIAKKGKKKWKMKNHTWHNSKNVCSIMYV